jgi:hypothetical protein
MIAEVSSAESGGDKAAWLPTAFSETIPTRLPATRAVIWFHKNKVAHWRGTLRSPHTKRWPPPHPTPAECLKAICGCSML